MPKIAIYSFLAIFNTFFAKPCDLRPDTRPKAMKMYSRGNLMLLNKFLTLFLHQTDFFTLSETQNEFLSTKKSQKIRRIFPCFSKFFCEKNLFWPAARMKKWFWYKNIVRNLFRNIKLTLELIIMAIECEHTLKIAEN